MTYAFHKINRITFSLCIQPGVATPGVPAAGAAAAASTDGKLELARRLASRINLAKGLGAEQKGATQQAAEAILKGAPSAHTLITVSTNTRSINIVCALS